MNMKSAAVLALVLFLGACGYSDGKFRLVTKEESLGKIPEGINSELLNFSPDGKRWACVVSRGDNEVVIVDGAEKDVCNSFHMTPPIFSPDSKRVMYAKETFDKEKRQRKARLVVDGVPGAEYDRITSMTFSSDSKRVGYVANRKGKYVVVVDGVESSEYDDVDGSFPPPFFGLGFDCAIFSPDGKQVAFSSKRGKKRGDAKWFVVIDGKESEAYDGLSFPSPVFSADGKTVAYGANNGDQWFVVVNGVKGKAYPLDKSKYRSPAVSSDGKHVAYAVVQDAKCFVVRDGVEGDAFEFDKQRGGIVHPMFSPDGKRLVYRGGREGKQSLVVDGVCGKAYDSIGGAVVISPDGKRFACRVLRFGPLGVRSAMAVDDKEYDEGGFLGAGSPAFSPDSQHLAYRLVCDRTEGQPKWGIAVDGMVTDKSYDEVWLVRSQLAFDSPTKFHTVALRNGEFLRVEVEIADLP